MHIGMTFSAWAMEYQGRGQRSMTDMSAFELFCYPGEAKLVELLALSPDLPWRQARSCCPLQWS